MREAERLIDFAERCQCTADAKERIFILLARKRSSESIATALMSRTATASVSTFE